jgi:ADP-ribosylglycohydrolase
MMPGELDNHILGGLFGLALGDAFAMPAYLRPAVTRERYGGWIEEFLPGPPDHPVHHGLPAGHVTDDTEQAFALAQAIIEAGKVTVDAAARALVSWYEAAGGDALAYVGPSTRRAVQLLRAGADPRTTGHWGDTNGGAMRICPVGLIHPGDPRGVIDDVVTACTPSHFTDVAISGAAAVAGAIAAALRPGSSIEDVLQAGRTCAAEGERYGTAWLGASIPRRIDAAVEIARKSAPQFDRIVDLYDLIGSTLSPAESVPSAFGILALADGDVMLCARYAAALSGDADTVGAMACAIAGAWHGAEAIPKELTAKLQSANPELDFVGVARGLSAIARGGPQ